MSGYLAIHDARVLVDLDLYEELARFSWHLAGTGYAVRVLTDGFEFNRPPLGSIYMHRQITGALPGEMVDHINHDKLDNRRENLRLCSNGQNQANRRPKESKLYSALKGVTRDKRRPGGWYAQVVHDGIAHNLGTFDSETDAARAYDRMAVKLHGEFALTNEAMNLLPPDDGDIVKRRLVRSDNTSGCAGVCFHKQSGLWRSRIFVKGKEKTTYHHSLELAIQARKRAHG